MTRERDDDLVIRRAAHLAPDPSRVYTALFVPGEEMIGDDSRATAVIDRVLGLDAAEVTAALAGLRRQFADRPSLDATFQRHFDRVAHRLAPDATPAPDRALLIGAFFTHDVSPEGAALTNPSIVAHPDQSSLEAGALRFVLSARAIGEGHLSTIEFRTGVVSAAGEVDMDELGPHLETPERQPSAHHRDEFWAHLLESGHGGDTAHLLLDGLDDVFTRAALDAAIARLDGRLRSRAAARGTVSRLLEIADNNYTVSFAEGTALSERILVPTGPTELNGVEDARLVRFVDAGTPTYLATYTAYDGREIQPQVLRTEDFRTFTAHQLCGPAAVNKGMALFPRRIAGRFACLSRWDRERSFVAWSDDGVSWDEPTPIQAPSRAWDLIQVGNCGSPLETADGWLVLTHGVGPMRTYSIGAMLLDIDEPSRVISVLPGPLIAPQHDERSGYVPNVVYTCGGLVHGDHLVVPYGHGDQRITIAVLDLPGLLAQLRAARA